MKFPLHCLAAAAALAVAMLAPQIASGQDRGSSMDAETLSENLRELDHEQSEIRSEIRRLRDHQNRLEELLRIVERQRRQQAQWESLQRRLQSDDLSESLSKSLERQRDDLEREIDGLWQLRVTSERQRDIAEQISFLREHDGKRSERLRGRLAIAAKDLEALHDGLQRWLDQPLDDASDSRAFEERLLELEEQVEVHWELVELVGEWIWAIEVEAFDEIEELEEEIDAFLTPDSVEPTERPNRHVDEQRPIDVSDESLARFRSTTLHEDVIPMLEAHCIECHGNEVSSGDLNLQSLISETPLVIHRAKWIDVMEQTKNHVMPPDDATQPSRKDREQLVLSLHNLIHQFDYSQVRHPGHEVTRRLTHQEYDNTVSDLFGVPVQVAARFPKELAGSSGFHNSGNTLFLQPTLMERYITAADEIVETLLPVDPKTDRQRAAIASVFLTPPASTPGESHSAESVLRRFVSRAYRRPLDENEQSRIMARYRDLIRLGNSHHDAIRSIVRQTLISPNFLLKFETSADGDTDQRINDWELANRLSYFLWASMPDDQLSSLARSGSLHRPDVLRGEVGRMLRHPRSASLGDQFAAQWLGSQHVGTRVRLDPIDNPWCTESLMKAMRDETSQFFHALVIDNEPVERLLDADFTFLNEELSNHYGIRGVQGPQMRRVDLRGSSRRGILGHASILATTSFPYRTSPVVRGKWVLDTLLGTPPPPPPPNVSELSDEILENETLTIRQKLARHRESSRCNACHREMDPIGLSLERYDWFGRYRLRSRRRLIDDRGSLPNGTEFSGLTGLNDVLRQQRSGDLLRQVTQKMLSYALGRQLEYYDETTVREILDSIGQHDNRFQPLIHEIVQSYPFQFKRSRP
ncbi:MAG: DUF1592 domain-containing protein [Planctomycetota bacterium]